MLLTARWLLTGATPPIKDGAILVEGETIREVGTRHWFAKQDIAQVIDLGESILIPGLVNAHCHLEFSALKEKIPPTRSFSKWVRELLTKNLSLSQDEKENGIRAGIAELLHGGATTVVDHRSHFSDPIPVPFRNFVMLEVLGPSEQQARVSLQKTLRKTQESSEDEGTYCLTPHALYSVPIPILEEVLGPRAGKSLLSIHILENQEEDQFFRQGSGPLSQGLGLLGGMTQFPVRSPIEWLHQQGWLGPHLLLVHANHLTKPEIKILRGTGVTVIHCPGSYRYFRNERFPLEMLFRHGIRIGLGTDSLGSNDSLSMLRQMRLMQEAFRSLGGEDLLRMATINGAIALGLDHEIGTIEVAKKADIVGVPLLDNEVDPYDALLLAEEANFSMIGGRILLPLS
jgi:cytosine/adenosine deaminase-related metal-dependent hydrolase